MNTIGEMTTSDIECRLGKHSWNSLLKETKEKYKPIKV
jgi:hypothetical protein